ncbi:BnaC07g33770D [Brassica napus]|uniref:BnaC07g33770D protein n=1 Tax=Brassica napus TaxID=3708 RepID=A0A078F9J7_BRANA|nr:BnaC07g33770D [Brassica napus]
MGGHGGLNILPQKRWNVYNFDNREKVRKDEEAAAKEAQIQREEARKRDAQSRLEVLRNVRGLAPLKRPSPEAEKGKDAAPAPAPAPASTSAKISKKKSGKKSLKELREERLKRERVEKERERALFMKQSQRSGGFSRR